MAENLSNKKKIFKGGSLMAEKLRAMTKFTNEHKVKVLLIFFAFCAILLALMTTLTIRNYGDTQEILAESISEKMVTMALATREAVDVEKFASYNSEADILNDSAYISERTKLQDLAQKLGAKYLYALKKIGDKYYFVYDTDPTVDEFFLEYEGIGEVHLEAFAGGNVATPYNADDEYGSFSTGAVPIYQNGKIIGVVGADTDDQLVEQNRNVQRANMITLLVVIILTLALMAIMLSSLLRRLKETSDKLYVQAHYDKLTSLPNRQYLFEHLEKLHAAKRQYAMFFIDLDNFKQVNDTAGHDAGDALLKNIGDFLASAHENTKAFRPTSGSLNVAARIGGDEFILVAPDITSEQSEQFAKELIEQLKNIPDKNIEKFKVGFSLGIANYPEDSESYHVLIKYADIAMYHAKNAGKNTYFVYNAEMKEKDEK